MVKIELHAHEKTISTCARISAEELVEYYIAKEYSAINITNHFICDYFDSLTDKSWDEKVDWYFSGYENAVNAARKIAPEKITIYPSMEIRFHENINDYLIFGLDPEFLHAHPDFIKQNIAEFHQFAKENGLLVIQAHPFRNGCCINRPENLDGVEVFNAHHSHDSRNSLALLYADLYGLIKTSGSDTHYVESNIGGGIISDFLPSNSAELRDLIKSGDYKLIEEWN